MTKRAAAIRNVSMVAAWLVAASLGLAQDFGAAPAPAIHVSVERVDPTSFPLVDVYFRVVDTVPNSQYHAIRAGDVKVTEAKGGSGTFAATELAGDNFAKPEIRPLAMALCVDRSLSVRRELTKLRDAAVNFLDGMSDNGPLADDATSLVMFAGFADLQNVLHVPLTTDKQTLKQIAFEQLDQVGIGTPLQKAWCVGIRDVAESNYPARGVLMLTDGQQFPPGEGPSTESIIQAAYSNGLPIFNFGFVKLFGDGGLMRDSVYRPEMIQMANSTEGAYFEPDSPVPVMPELPAKPKDPADPAALPDKDAEAYSRKLLALALEQVQKDPAKALPTMGPTIALITGRPNISPAEIATIDPATEPGVAQVAPKLSYNDLLKGDAAVGAGLQQTATNADMEKAYVEQMSNMFTKVRASLKTLYRVTFRSSGEFRGEARDIKLTVAYEARKGAEQVALTGEGVGRYITPMIAEEDAAQKIVSTLNPQSPVNGLLFGAGAAPRDGAWKGPTQISLAIDLMTSGADGRPVTLATRSPKGEVTIADGPASSFDSKDREALAGYLSSVDLQVTADPAAGTVAADLTARTPTCARDPEHPWGRPIESAEAEGFRKLVWYRIQAEARRAYDYVATVPTAAGEPGGDIPSVGEVRSELPMMVAFVTDTTSPTVAVYLTPQSSPTSSRLEALELPVDAPARPRLPVFQLTGADWTPELSSRFAGARSQPTTLFPLDVDGAKVEGVYVRQNVRLLVQALARDNYDRNKDQAYLTLGGSALPAHDQYSEEDPGKLEAHEGQAPFLAHLKREETDKPGIAWWVEEDGVPTGEASADLVFRRSNVPDGPSIVLVSRARDAAGNVTLVRMPVKVLPQGFEMRQLTYESKRAD